MMARRTTRFARAAWIARTVVVLTTALSFAAAGCVHIFRRVEPEPISASGPPVTVESPIKVHLVDGRVALFPNGGTFQSDSLYGPGRIFPLNLQSDTVGTAIAGLPLAQIAAMETYDEQVLPVESLVVSTLATAATTVGTAAALVLIFGSCPTVYDGSAATLQAETFPNSIVPLFEMRDVDLLSLNPAPVGTLELEIRNEALETHYINHLELLEVVHPKGTTAYPDKDGGIQLAEHLNPPLAASDRTGRDVLSTLSAQDSSHYETPDAVLRQATEEDLWDHIDLTFPAPESDTLLLALRLRNSLLSSVFFYEYMLDAQGANALNWLSREVSSVRGAVELGGFYREYMGLRVQILENGRYREVARVREVGPIAFDHFAVRIPTSRLTGTSTKTGRSDPTGTSDATLARDSTGTRNSTGTRDSTGTRASTDVQDAPDPDGLDGPGDRPPV